jgi:CheY-like chemotaxis protein
MPDFEPVEILLVEDSATDAELALRGLKRFNLANRVHWVKDGAEALDFIFCRGQYAERSPEQKPRLVLLDLKLPKIGGLEVLKAIKSDERTRTIPVVVLTSSAEECDVEESYRNYVNSYIVKPVDFAQFLEVVAKANYYWLATNTTPAA